MIDREPQPPDRPMSFYIFWGSFTVATYVLMHDWRHLYSADLAPAIAEVLSTYLVITGWPLLINGIYQLVKRFTHRGT